MAGNPPEAHRFKPGQSGNPGGRPKGTFSISRLMRENLAIEVEVDLPDGRKEKMPLAQAIALNQQLKAAGIETGQSKKADTFAAGFTAERTEGKVADKLQLVDKREQTQQADPSEIVSRLEAVLSKFRKAVTNGDPGGAARGGRRRPARGRGLH